MCIYIYIYMYVYTSRRPPPPPKFGAEALRRQAQTRQSRTWIQAVVGVPS